MTQNVPVLEPTSQLSEMSDGFVDQQQYYSELTKYYKGHNENSKKSEWTCERIMNVINMIDDFYLAKVEGRRPTNKQYHHAHKYDVMTVGDDKILIIKRKSDSDPVVQIIPSTEYYQLLLDTHIATDHGRRDKIVHMLRDKFVIPIFAITIFLRLCKTCLLKRSIPRSLNYVKSLKDSFNGKEQLEFGDIQRGLLERKWQNPNRVTKFCYLRPLRREEVKEVPIETAADSNSSASNTDQKVDIKVESTLHDEIDIEEHQTSPTDSIKLEDNKRKRLKVEHIEEPIREDQERNIVNEINRNVISILKVVNERKDEYDAFGSYIATVLRCLPPDAAIVAKTELQTTLANIQQKVSRNT